jgi:hypothetical protein
VVGIGPCEETLKTFRYLIASENAVTIAIERHQALYGFIGFIGVRIGRAGEIFEGGQLAVMVEVESEKRGTGSRDLLGRELAILMGIERQKCRTWLRRTGSLCQNWEHKEEKRKQYERSIHEFEKALTGMRTKEVLFLYRTDLVLYQVMKGRAGPEYLQKREREKVLRRAMRCAQNGGRGTETAVSEVQYVGFAMLSIDSVR